MGNASYKGALDIGGTKLLAGIIDDTCELVVRRRIETRASRGATDVITRHDFTQALHSLREYAEAEHFPASVITQRAITREFAEQLARECDA